MDRPPAARTSSTSRSVGGKAPGDPSAPTTLDENVRRLVRAFLGHSPLNNEEFGRLVLGTSRFVASLDTGRPLTLDIADRLLRFMGETPIGPTFRSEVAAYLTITGTRASSLGEKAVGNRSFVSKLKSGTSPLLADVQKVRARMRKTANDEQRAAIARAIADDGQEGRVLSPDPAALETLAEDSAAATADNEKPRDSSSPNLDLRLFLTAREAADLLRILPSTLAGYRSKGVGPAYHLFGGRVVYARADLLSWAWTRRRGLYHEVL